MSDEHIPTSRNDPVHTSSVTFTFAETSCGGCEMFPRGIEVLGTARSNDTQYETYFQ